MNVVLRVGAHCGAIDVHYRIMQKLSVFSSKRRHERQRIWQQERR